MCHFYNTYFAHTAGGRMIGSKVSQMILDNKQLNFYKYDSDVKELLSKVRDNINEARHMRVDMYLLALPMYSMHGYNCMVPEMLPMRGAKHMQHNCPCSIGLVEKLSACAHTRALLQVAEGWTREQKDKCLDETEKAFSV